MWHYPEFNPVAFTLGPLEVHWYGIMYLFGFFGAWCLARYRASQPNSGWKQEWVSDLIFYCAVGVVLGGRMGYMFFYNFPVLLERPFELFKIWQGGMSFHGGMLGVVVATLVFARRHKKHWSEVIDFVAPLVPLGLGMGRLGNFINGELWGRVTDLPWAMIFPQGGPWARHPSQLYEFLLEGVLLFVIVWWYSSKRRPPLAVTALFATVYGIFRFLVEFFREPDIQLGFIAGNWLTMGQLLSLGMILFGAMALWWSYQHKDY